MSSIKFNGGADAYGSVPNGNATIDAVLTGDAYTVDFWTKLDTLGDGAAEAYFVSYGPDWYSGWNPLFNVYVHTAGQVGWIHPTSMESAAGVLSTGQWHHLAFVFDGSTRYIYVDGSLVLSKAYGGGALSGASDFYIGKHGYPTYARQLDGEMDGVRMWNRALTASEISTYYSTDVVSQTGIQAYWSMDEGTGSTSTDTVSNIVMTMGGAYTWSGASPGTIGAGGGGGGGSVDGIVAMSLGSGTDTIIQIGKMDIS